jgi:hypothetical protein
MPLRDHFGSPPIDRHSWSALLGGWPMTIAVALNRELPPEYAAGPLIRRGSRGETERPDVNDYEVHVYAAEQTLVAAVQIVSPSNKEASNNRRAFVARCIALLRRNVCVTIVDVATNQDVSLYAELLTRLDGTDATSGGPPAAIYAVTCRGRGQRLEAWHHPLAVGHPLPSLPLWLSEELAARLDLEATYEETCRGLRIR